jgi:hypothetical protein
MSKLIKKVELRLILSMHTSMSNFPTVLKATVTVDVDTDDTKNALCDVYQIETFEHNNNY